MIKNIVTVIAECDHPTDCSVRMDVSDRNVPRMAQNGWRLEDVASTKPTKIICPLHTPGYVKSEVLEIGYDVSPFADALKIEENHPGLTVVVTTPRESEAVGLGYLIGPESVVKRALADVWDRHDIVTVYVKVSV